MITGDLDRVLATEINSAGTWRPGAPGTGPAAAAAYASSIAFRLARGRHTGAAGIAAGLAATLAPLTWVDTAAVTGGGYLTVTVTPDALAALAVRVTQAGPACARSDALRGTAVTAPSATTLTTAPTWAQARDRLARHLTGRLAQAAGAMVTWTDDPEREEAGEGGPAGPAGRVAEAIAFAGAGPVTFALARLPPGGCARLDPRAVAAHRFGNPAYAVRYAYAHAASVLCQAADLGLDRGGPAGFQPRLLRHPCEQELLGAMSWLPERVAGAARRRRPDVLARYLEELAGTYFGWHERCPAVWPGMTGGPGDPVTVARLWLAAAAATALAAGLSLLGVDAPDRL